MEAPANNDPSFLAVSEYTGLLPFPDPQKTQTFIIRYSLLALELVVVFVLADHFIGKYPW